MELKQNVVYWCRTEEALEDFMAKAKKSGYNYINSNTDAEPIKFSSSGCCYILGKTFKGELYFTSCSLDLFKKIGYEIVEYTSKKASRSTITIIKHEVAGNKVTVTLSNGSVGVAECSAKNDFNIERLTNLAISKAYNLTREKKYVRILDDFATCIWCRPFIAKNFPQLEKYYDEGFYPERGKVYKYLDERESKGAANYIIQDINTNRIYVIESTGCWFVDEPDGFTPYLRFDNANFGSIGSKTNLVDIFGNKLYVGDTVSVYHTEATTQEFPIVHTEDRDWVKGFCNCDWLAGWRSPRIWIIKNRSYKEINEHEVISGIEYVLKEDK